MHESAVSAYAAQLLDADNPDDMPELQRLQGDPNVEFIDRLDTQMANLANLRPAPPPELLAEPGRWAYYPWRRAVVAVLGPRGYRAVRLDRNRNNITSAE